MPATSPCVPCCSTPLSVNVPGTVGAGGLNGAAGQSAFTTLTAILTLPAAVGDTVAGVAVADTSWMAYGQTVIVGDEGGTKFAEFKVMAINSAISVDLKLLGYPGSVAPTGTLASGARVSASGQWGLPAPITSYKTALAYNVAGTLIALAAITGGPSVTLTQAGTYVIFACAKIDTIAATANADKTTVQLFRSNNTPAAIANSDASAISVAYATAPTTIGVVSLPVIIYPTLNANDNIVMYAGCTTTLHSTITDADLVAVRIF